MSVEIIGVFIPIVGLLVGGAIAIVAIVSDHRQKIAMVKNGMEIPKRKPSSNPLGGFRFGALMVGVAIGIIVGGIIENSGVFSSPEVGYFSSIFLFGGAAQILASLYMNKKLQHKN